MQIISSKDNELIKHIRKLKDKKYRDESNEFVIEGVKLVAEAIQENSKIKYIVLCDDCERSDFISKELMYEIAKYECIYVTEKLFKYLSQVQTPQGVLAIIEKNNIMFVVHKNKYNDLNSELKKFEEKVKNLKFN